MTVQEFKNEFEKYMKEEEGKPLWIIKEHYWETVVTRASKDSQFIESQTEYQVASTTYNSLDKAMAAIKEILECREYTSNLSIHIKVKHKFTRAAMKLPLEDVIDIKRTQIMPQDLARILTPELRDKYVEGEHRAFTIWRFR